MNSTSSSSSSSSSAGAPAASASSAEVVIHKEGWLTKKAVRTLLKNSWKTRWVVLDGPSRTLTYSKGKGEKPIFSLSISSTSSVALTEEHKRPYEFRVQTDRLAFYACAERKPEAQEWVDTIGALIESMGKNSFTKTGAAVLDTRGFVVGGARDSLAVAMAIGKETGPLAKSEVRALPPPPIEANAAQKLTNLVKAAASKDQARLFSWGDDEFGQLGLSSTNACGIPTAVEVSVLKQRNSATTLAAGARFSAAISASEQLFLWGAGYAGQLGCGASVTKSSRPFPVPAFRSKRVLAVACGGSHTLAIVADPLAEVQLVTGTLPQGVATHSGSIGGALWAWGTSHVGALGLGAEKPYSPEPSLVVFASGGGGGPPSITSVFAGPVSSGAIVGGTQLYVWGDGGYGRLGLASVGVAGSTPVWNPTLLPLIDESGSAQLIPQAVALGGTFSAFLGRPPSLPPGAPCILFTSGTLGADAVIFEDAAASPTKDSAYEKGGAVQLRILEPLGPVKDPETNEYPKLPMPPITPTPTPTASFGWKNVCVSASAGLTHLAVVVQEPPRDQAGLKMSLIEAARKASKSIEAAGASTAAVAAAALPPPPPSATAAPKRLKGSMYTAGYGFLGHLATEHYKTARQDLTAVVGIALDEDIVNVSCGRYFTLARSITGEIMGWGSNPLGNLNTGRFIDLALPVMAVEPTGFHYAQIAVGLTFAMGLQLPGQLGDVKARSAARTAFGKWRQKIASRRAAKAETVAAGSIDLKAMMEDIAGDEGISGGLQAAGITSFQDIIGQLLRSAQEEQDQESALAVAASAMSAASAASSNSAAASDDGDEGEGGEEASSAAADAHAGGMMDLLKQLEAASASGRAM